MTREEFFYQCQDVIEHWLNGNRKLSELREVTDKLYNEVTRPHWISVEDEMPKGGFAIITNGDDVLVGKYNFEKGLWGVRNKTMFAYTLLPANWKVTHWMPLPQAPTCSEKPNNCEKGGEE